MDFGGSLPEINSERVYSGPGYRSVTARLADG